MTTKLYLLFIFSLSVSLHFTRYQHFNRGFDVRMAADMPSPTPEDKASSPVTSTVTTPAKNDQQEIETEEDPPPISTTIKTALSSSSKLIILMRNALFTAEEQEATLNSAALNNPINSNRPLVVKNETTKEPSRPQSIYWLHIPKTGTSFFNTLARFLCPPASSETSSSPTTKTTASISSLPPDLLLTGSDLHEPKKRIQSYCDFAYAVDPWASLHRIQGGHQPLPDFWFSTMKTSTLPGASVETGVAKQLKKQLLKVFTFLRNPIKRIRSGFLHHMHDCPRLALEEGCLEDGEMANVKTNPSTQSKTSEQTTSEKSSPLKKSCRDHILDLWSSSSEKTSEGTSQATEKKEHLRSLIHEYTECVGGCSTNMLLGRKCDEKIYKTKDEIPSDIADTRSFGSPTVLAEELVILASLVVSKIQFLGVMEYWFLSICLFHRMFWSLEGGTLDGGGGGGGGAKIKERDGSTISITSSTTSSTSSSSSEGTIESIEGNPSLSATASATAFNTTFNIAPILPTELRNNRPESTQTNKKQFLHDFIEEEVRSKNPVDTGLYETAQRVFWDRRMEWGVNEESCRALLVEAG